jgi:UPF0271 protein
LVPRGESGDVIGDVAVVRERLKTWRETGFLTVGSGAKWMVEAETVCVHADSPGSVAIARVVREVVREREET